MSRPTAPEPASLPWSSAMLVALLATLTTPPAWLVGLAGFLARGGIVLVVLPIVVLPTPAGVANAIGPALVLFYFGQVPLDFLVLVGVAVGLLLLWIVLGGLVGAWADVTLPAMLSAEDELEPPFPPLLATGRPVVRVFVVRLLAHVPLALALAWGAVRIVQATYAELTNPLEVVTPLVVRVASDVPDALLVVALAWLVGETAGGLAYRYRLAGASLAASLRDGYLDIVRHAGTVLATTLVTLGVLLATIVPSLVAANVAWSRVRFLLRSGAPPPETFLTVVVFVALWIGGLALIAGVVTWRSHAWSFEWLRHAVRRGRVAAPSDGVDMTIGGAEQPRPGEWPSSGASGRL